VAVQHAMVGAPMTYYGNEAGMWSPDDPSNRQPMTWPGIKFDDPQVAFAPEVFDFCQRVIAVRNRLKPLQLGFFRGVLMEDDRGVYAFARDLGGETVYVVINRSNQQRKIDVPADGLDGAKLVNWLDVESAQVMQKPGSRPAIELKPTARGVAVNDGRFVMTLEPFATAVLTKQ
jgi:glycosidase